MNGLALTIVVGQLPKLFGFSVDADGLIGELAPSSRAVADGERDGAARRSASLPGADPGAEAPAGRSAERARCRRPRDRAVTVFDLTTAGSTPSACCPRASRRSPFRWCRGPTWPCCSPARSASSRSSPGRHHVDRVGLRRPPGEQVRREPGDDRHRRGQHRRRLLPGLPGQHQRLAHRGRRAGRRPSRRSPAWSARRRSSSSCCSPPGLMQYVPQPTLGAIVIAAALSLADVARHRAGSGGNAGRSSRCRSSRCSASRSSVCCPASWWPSACRSSTSSAASGGPTRPSSAGLGRVRAARHGLPPDRRAPAGSGRSTGSTHR